MSNGWSESARAWIAALGEAGDFTRAHVLDRPMLARVDAGAHARALDVGCGEGRFCRMLRARGIEAIGIDPTRILIEEARRRDPGGDYRIAGAEALPFEDGSFDLVVSYLSLIDIAGLAGAIAEMARVLAPGGTLLIANLASFATTPCGGVARRWEKDAQGRKRFFRMDGYLDISFAREAWKGIDIVNHHRPLSTYMSLLLGEGLRLVHFDEPRASGGDPRDREDYDRVPYAFLMEWRKA